MNIGLESRLKLFAGACVHARMHSARKRARYFCAFFPTFWCPFFAILKPFQTENEKNGSHLSERYQQDATFLFSDFFSYVLGSVHETRKRARARNIF